MRLTVEQARKRLAELEAAEARAVRQLEEAVEADDTYTATVVERKLERIADRLSFVRSVASYGDQGHVYERAR